ncbi:MAG: hypothetical protein KAS99_00940 [Candidatus Omnitrophica bacterium]|nr:hypothetical protein [Candidatus Omnitrophota bacterium]
MKFKKINNWVEIGILSFVNLILLIAIIVVYNLTSPLWIFLLYIVFLNCGIFLSHKQKFEKSNLFLSEKGKRLMFMKSYLPYVLQTMFFSQCSLLVAWILLNM